MTEPTPPTVPVAEGADDTVVTEEPGMSAPVPAEAEAVPNIDSTITATGVPCGDTPLSDRDARFRTDQTARMAEYDEALTLARATLRDLSADIIRARALGTAAEVAAAQTAEAAQAARIANLEEAIAHTQILLDSLSPPYCPVESEDDDDPERIARRARIAQREAEAAAEAARLEPDPVRVLAEHNERSPVVAHRDIR